MSERAAYDPPRNEDGDVICRRCGLGINADHVKSPYLCELQPDRRKVSRAFTKARLRVVPKAE